MSTCVLKALPGNLDIKRHSPSILYVFDHCQSFCYLMLSCTKYFDINTIFDLIKCDNVKPDINAVFYAVVVGLSKNFKF